MSSCWRRGVLHRSLSWDCHRAQAELHGTPFRAAQMSVRLFPLPDVPAGEVAHLPLVSAMLTPNRIDVPVGSS